MLEIPLGKQLTANFLIETCTKLKELNPAAIVKCGLTRVQLPLWLPQSLMWYFIGWYVLGHSGQRASVKSAEAAWNYKVRET